MTDREYLTPDQIEKLKTGWYTAVVLGPSDLDVMHAGLTLPYCDNSTKDLWKEIRRQGSQRSFLDKVGDLINRLGTE